MTMASVNREQIAREWAKRGFICDIWIDAPGKRWEKFTHATDELIVVLEGDMEFEIAGKVSRPSIGEEVLVPALAVHSTHNIGSTAARWLYGYKR
jgi:mannose-6-phosphate isomerase-like protein (cupin superfamily)